VVIAAYTLLALRWMGHLLSWGDEVQFADPGANLYFNHAFVTTVWPYQTDAEIFFGNAPLYSLMLGAWYHLVGFGLFQTRILTWIFAVIGIIFSVAALGRARVIPGAWRTALVTLFLTGFGLSVSIWSARYDMPGFAILAALVWGIAARGGVAAAVVRTIAMILIPLVGFHLVIVVGVLYLLLLWTRAIGIRGFMIDLAILGAAVVAMIAFFSANVGLKRFAMLTLFSNHTVFGQAARGAKRGMSQMLETKLSTIAALFTQDPTYTIVLATAAVLAVFLRRERRGALDRTDIALFAGAVALPLLLSLMGKYPAYYSWIGWAVACTLFLRLLGRMAFGAAWLRPAAIVALVAVCAVVGVGRYLSERLAASPSAGYVADLDGAIDRYVAPGEVAYADMGAWFDVWRRARHAYADTYAQNSLLPGYLTPQPITALVVSDDAFGKMSRLAGGNWRCVWHSRPGQPAGVPSLRLCKRD
jgi:hypothetical protein